MVNEITQSMVYQILRDVMHPELEKRNIVELNMIREVKIGESSLDIKLALPTLEASVKQELMNRIQEKVSGLKSGLQVRVQPVEMEPQVKEAFQTAVQEELKVSPKAGVEVRKVLAVMSGKGGVGKSSVAGLLASSLNHRGLKVGLLDADITGPSIPMMFGAHGHPESSPEGILPVPSREGIKLMSINLLLPDEDQAVVWRGPLISRAIQQFWSDIAWGDLDVLIVDLPPGTSDASLTVMQSLPLDGIVLVTSPRTSPGWSSEKQPICPAAWGSG